MNVYSDEFLPVRHPSLHKLFMRKKERYCRKMQYTEYELCESKWKSVGITVFWSGISGQYNYRPAYRPRTSVFKVQIRVECMLRVVL